VGLPEVVERAESPIEEVAFGYEDDERTPAAPRSGYQRQLLNSRTNELEAEDFASAPMDQPKFLPPLRTIDQEGLGSSTRLLRQSTRYRGPRNSTLRQKHQVRVDLGGAQDIYDRNTRRLKNL